MLLLSFFFLFSKTQESMKRHNISVLTRDSCIRPKVKKSVCIFLFSVPDRLEAILGTSDLTGLIMPESISGYKRTPRATFGGIKGLVNRQIGWTWDEDSSLPLS